MVFDSLKEMPYKNIMNTLKLFFTIAVSVFWGIAHGESYTYSENTELSGAEPMVITADAPLELDVTSGATVTVSRVISGSGKLVKKGSGTLILAAKNLFEGGVDFVDGDIWVRSEGALGSGRVTFTEKGARSIWFDAPDATFDNDFLVDAESDFQIKVYLPCRTWAQNRCLSSGWRNMLLSLMFQFLLIHKFHILSHSVHHHVE